MLGGNDAVLDRLVAMLEAEDEEHAAAAERQDSDVAMQLYEADLVDAGLRPNVSTSTMLADMQQRLEAAEASELAEQAAWHARKKRLEDQNAKRHALRRWGSIIIFQFRESVTRGVVSASLSVLTHVYSRRRQR